MRFAIIIAIILSFSCFFQEENYKTTETGELNFTFNSNEKILKKAFLHAKQEIERACNIKLNIKTNGIKIFIVNEIRENPSIQGSAYFESGKPVKVLLKKKSKNFDGVVLHELMHCVGIMQDERVNDGDSIMDYSYKGKCLTEYDKHMLSVLYPKMP